MELKELYKEREYPFNIIGRWVHTKEPFIIQWEAINNPNSSQKCKKLKPIHPIVLKKTNLAYVCDIQKINEMWTVTCYFPNALGHKGGIGQQTALDVDELIRFNQ